ncbi:MAG: hypothetical protein JW909_09870 [Planctomycetes bacterium]|nr:hypothetical protein [Planctomycetota bacterium]
MPGLATRERMSLMYSHREADRVPVTDSPWGSTIERWHAEGMPHNVDFIEYFDLDRIVSVGADNSPRYPVEVLEETDDYKVATTKWGATLKNWKHSGGVPEFLDFTIVDPASWAEAKKRMTPDRNRIAWDRLEAHYEDWRAKGCWISGGFWFGFDVTHSWTVGTERLLVALAMQPEWAVDMFNTFLDLDIALFDMIFDEGYELDEITWPDDMGYKLNQFFSLDMYRELLKPVHRRACEWAHERGIRTRLHSCGDIRPFVPELVEIGVDMLNPLEVKAGMDPIALKREYGDRLAFHGGLNAVLYTEPEKMWEEMRRVIPVMKQNGGYVAGSDHSVPQSVSLEEFREFTRLAKELGSYA